MRKTLVVISLASLTTALMGCSPSSDGPPVTAATSGSSTTSSTPTPTATLTPTPEVKPTMDPVDAAFKKKVEAWCQVLRADMIQHQPPFYVGNPLGLTREQLPQAAAYLDSLRISHELVAGSKDMGVPEAGKASWSTLLSDFEAFQKYETAAISGGKASDLVAWTTQSSAAEHSRDAVLNDLIVAGLAVPGPCPELFARSSYHG